MNIGSQIYGAVIFETPKTYDPISNNPGYKCIAGEEPERIFGTGELPSSARWLSNITLEQAHNMQLRNTPKLLDDKFLRTATSTIILELGLKKSAFSKQASVIAGIYRNVMELSNIYFGLPENPVNALASGLPSLMGHYQPLISDKKVVEAASKAILPYTNCERKNLGDIGSVEFVSLVLPRVKHSQNVLSSGIPWDDFEFLTQAQLPSQSNRLSWVVNSDLPIIAKVKIPKIDKSFNHLINWGNGAGIISKKNSGSGNYSTLNPRDYVTSNELRKLAEFSDIEIDEIAISNTPVENRTNLPGVSKLSTTSYSFGLLCENIWCSLTRDQNGQPKRSPMTAWLHATDRMLCLEYASALSRLGFTINGYGYGRITLVVTEEQKNDLRRAAFDLGLMPSLELNSTLNSDLNDSNNPDSILRFLYENGYLDDLLYLDDQYIMKIRGNK